MGCVCASGDELKRRACTFLTAPLLSPRTGRYTPFLLIYKTYTNNYADAMDTVRKLKEHSGARIKMLLCCTVDNLPHANSLSFLS